MKNNDSKADKEKSSSNSKIAVIRVRGRIGVNSEVEDAMKNLRLYNNNFCSVVSDTPKIKGMIKKAKDYITWGEIDEETFKLLIEKRGEEYKGNEKDSKNKINYNRKFVEISGKKYKKFFRLNPPKKGFGRKGIKIPFSKGGALGDRKEKINDLLKRMI